MDGARYAVLIASSTFPNESRLHALTAPENDVDGLKEVLLSKDRGCFSDVTVLKNRPHYEIATHIHKVFKLAQKDDLVMVYYSGHGKLNQSGDLYLTATDTNVDELESSAVGVVRIREFLNGSKSKKVVIILDCCFSGAIEGAFSKSTVDDQLRVEASKARGTYIMTASTGIQTALQKAGDLHSVFTKHLIAGIETGEADTNRNGVITADELYEYLHPRVCEESHQEPTRWNINTEGHLVIAASGRQPRKEREKALRDLLFKLVNEQRISDEILTEALNIISRPAESLSPADSERDTLLDQLHDEKINPARFLMEWIAKGIAKDHSDAVAREAASPKQKETSSGSDRRQSPPSDWKRLLSSHWERLLPSDWKRLLTAFLIGAGTIVTFIEYIDTPEDEALRIELEAAEEGDADEQFYLGFKYALSRDFGKAAKWYRKAAEQGHAEAQHRIGTMYERGVGVPQDTAKALEWYRKAAEQGEADAKYRIGIIYERGLGVPKDTAKALEWYRKAAEQGYVDAQYRLGLIFIIGMGNDVPKDAIAAVEWFRKAAEQGDARAQLSLGERYFMGEGVPHDDAKAAEWFRKAAEKGHADAQLNIGFMYSKGKGVTKDATQAVEWYRKAAEEGHAGAQYNLGAMYEDGEGAPQDYAIAMGWYRKAAEQEFAQAQFSLGLMYSEGKSVPKDYTKALEWIEKAAEQGHARAQYTLALIYRVGVEGVPRDAAKAEEWDRKALQSSPKPNANLTQWAENAP